ncbi:replication-relaxation family protein [Parerythrobacter lacustris]|uniref:Replication-relaxation family protein n=1 Tax=Parerythrobacter lacustris TaxID=2969984 RepID=A0ABT1XPA4_9SPHN|nr:replication-relaxation family protein [Parerythrobacter lacustris]MCR2833495.1 replication-relaxation family protein [Parerythrobacter lacustris]
MATDTQGRRLRFAPPAPKENEAVIPQEADLAAWAAISRHGPLPITYLAQFGEPRNRANLQRRYTRFYHQGWLTRPARQYASFHARYSPLVYDLAPKAQALLGKQACAVAPSRSAPFVHQLMQACFTASLELTAPKRGFRFVPRDELLAHPKCRQRSLTLQLAATKLTPDDLFAIERPDGKKRIFFLEVDRNTESIERSVSGYNTWSKKVAAYDEMFRLKRHTEAWGFPAASVLIVTTNDRHAENLRSYIEKKSPAADRFIYAFEETFGANWRVPKALLASADMVL